MFIDIWSKHAYLFSWLLAAFKNFQLRIFFFPYIALISAFAAQMALLGFLFFLSLSLPERVTLWSRIIPVHVRERERGKKKEEKSPEKNHFAMTGI